MPSPPPSGQAKRFALAAWLLCALTTVAAVVSFFQGSWLGVVWVLMAGLSSNMAWYYGRRAKQAGAARAAD